MSTQTDDQQRAEEQSPARVLHIWDEAVQLKLGQYTDGSTAVRLETTSGEPFATISAWFPESRSLPRDVVYVKDWSENESIVPILTQAGWIAEAPEYPALTNGWVTSRAYRVTAMEVEQCVEQRQAATGRDTRVRQRRRQIEME